MPHTLRSILLLGILLLLPAVVRAQSIRGEVVEQGTAAPVMGAFVRLLDAGGVQRAAALSDSAGRFLVRAPAPGAYRLQARMGSIPDPVRERPEIKVPIRPRRLPSAATRLAE